MAFALAPVADTGRAASQQVAPLAQLLSPDVRCSITVPNSLWEQDGPALISVRLENITDVDLEFETSPTLYLTSAERTPWSHMDYWAPTDIVRNKPLAIRTQHVDGKAAEAIEPVPLKLRLAKRAFSMFQVDAAKTHWAPDISSVWPTDSLHAVIPGPYVLRLELEVAGKLVRSNEVRVSVAKPDSQHK
jgi:hypothetical protein